MKRVLRYYDTKISVEIYEDTIDVDENELDDIDREYITLSHPELYVIYWGVPGNDVLKRGREFTTFNDAVTHFRKMLDAIDEGIILE